MGLDLGFDDRYCRPTLWAELRMGGAAVSRPGSRSRAVIWNGRTLLKPLVKKHARLAAEFYLFEQRWAKIQDFNSTYATHENFDLSSDREEVDHHRI